MAKNELEALQHIMEIMLCVSIVLTLSLIIYILETCGIGPKLACNSYSLKLKC